MQWILCFTQLKIFWWIILFPWVNTCYIISCAFGCPSSLTMLKLFPCALNSVFYATLKIFSLISVCLYISLYLLYITWIIFGTSHFSLTWKTTPFALNSMIYVTLRHSHRSQSLSFSFNLSLCESIPTIYSLCLCSAMRHRFSLSCRSCRFFVMPFIALPAVWDYGCSIPSSLLQRRFFFCSNTLPAAYLS